MIEFPNLVYVLLIIVLISKCISNLRFQTMLQIIYLYIYIYIYRNINQSQEKINYVRFLIINSNAMELVIAKIKKKWN